MVLCRGDLLIWIKVGQGPTALAVGAGGSCSDICSLVYHSSFYAPKGTSRGILKSHRQSVRPSVTNVVSAISH